MDDFSAGLRRLLTMGGEDCSLVSLPHAKWFDMQLPFRCRAWSETAWQEGHTTNMSRTGEFFMAGQTMQAGTQLEMSFTIRTQGGDEIGAKVTFRGKNVRAVRLRPQMPGPISPPGFCNITWYGAGKAPRLDPFLTKKYLDVSLFGWDLNLGSDDEVFKMFGGGHGDVLTADLLEEPAQAQLDRFGAN